MRVGRLIIIAIIVLATVAGLVVLHLITGLLAVVASAPFIIFAVVATPMLAFLAWVLLRRWSVEVGPRQAGLVIRRGRATDTTLPTGVHFVAPWNQTVEIYPAYEMTYMAAAPDSVALGSAADVDYLDPPYTVIDQDHFTAEISYTLRFTIIRGELKQIRERFGPEGIKGVIRDASRHVIQTAYTQDNCRLIDLGGPSHAALEDMLAERIKDQLATNGFALISFSLQAPDLRELGQLLGEQATVQAGLTIEEIRARVDEVRNRRQAATARVEAQIEAERVRTRSTAEADAALVRARAEAEAEEERQLGRATATGKAREIEVAKRLELVAMEADLRLKRAEALARSNRALADGLSELAVRLESIEAWREVMERWDGRMAPPALSPGTPSPLSAPQPPLHASGPVGQADTGEVGTPVPPRSTEVDDHGA